MQHPFELKITDLHAIELELEDLTTTESTQVVGGTSMATTLAVGEEGGGITADGVGPNEVGGPFTVSTQAVGEEGGTVTTLAVGEEGGSPDCFPRGIKPSPKPKRHRKY